jgi:hypothetical protein
MQYQRNSRGLSLRNTSLASATQDANVQRGDAGPGRGPS